MGFSVKFCFNKSFSNFTFVRSASILIDRACNFKAIKPVNQPIKAAPAVIRTYIVQFQVNMVITDIEIKCIKQNHVKIQVQTRFVLPKQKFDKLIYSFKPNLLKKATCKNNNFVENENVEVDVI